MPWTKSKRARLTMEGAKVSPQHAKTEALVYPCYQHPEEHLRVQWPNRVGLETWHRSFFKIMGDA